MGRRIILYGQMLANVMLRISLFVGHGKISSGSGFVHIMRKLTIGLGSHKIGSICRGEY